MISDKTGKSIVFDKTKDKFAVYDNLVGVLTDNPTFNWNLINVNEYMNIVLNQPKETKWSNEELKPLSFDTKIKNELKLDKLPN